MSLQPACFSSRRVRRLAERAMSGRLTARQARALDRQLAGDPGDRRAYHTLSRMFAAVEGGRSLAAGQRERVLAAVLARAGGRPVADGARGWVRLAARLAPVATAVVLALVVGLTLLQTPRPPSAGWQARGGGGAEARAGAVGLEALCVRAGAIVPAPERRAGPPVDALCSSADELQLLVTHQAGYPYLVVLGHLRASDGRERMLWYYPAPPTGRSGPAPRDVRDEPLGQSVRLAVNHRPGRLRVVGLLSEAPVDAEQAYAWLRLVPWDEPAAAAVEQLVGPPEASGMTVVETRVMIEEQRP